MNKKDEEVKSFLEFHQDLLALVDKHHVTLEWLAEFVKVYSEFGWQVGTAQAVAGEQA